ncbi:uncharacterized protein LOC132553314 [Ylistrum balloti]|uniref:uncharacterized protein LOC132553314 n=1 Tax=Ylistrum balloti TaxID=509963 RepID=UPI002905E052|nr:uncharacterized protein LOC132553314 [Ylistrum balloti]
MTIVYYNPSTKGRSTRIVHALLVCTTLAKGVGVAYIVTVSLMWGREGVLDQGTKLVFNQFSIFGLPMGDLSEGVTFTIFVMLPLHSIFGVLGLLGVLCRNKLLVLLYTGFLTLVLITDIGLLVFTSILLNGLTTWITESFITSYSYYNTIWINPDLQAAWNALFVKMECCGVTGSNNFCSGIPYTVGCWHKYYSPMTGYLWSLFALFIGSIILDVVGIVISELAYQRLDSKPKCTSGMYRQFAKFVLRSWKMNKGKVIFAIITVIDTMAGLGLIVAGVVTLRSDFVSNSYLTPLFGNLRFYNMYLPDLMLGLGITMITTGVFNTGTCSLALNIICFKTKSKINVARLLYFTMIVVNITALVFWSIMLYGVRALMEFQLYKEFLGYDSTYDSGDYYTNSWRALFVTFKCCRIYGLWFTSMPLSAGVPEQCLYERTPVNSNLNYVGVTVATGDIVQEVCQEKLADEIYKYQVAVAVLFGIAILSKVYAIGYLFTKDNQTGDGMPFSVTLNQLRRKKKVVALVCVLVTGFLVSLGILITGAILKFDNVFGHKDIQHLFVHVYVSGSSLFFWMLALSNYLVIMGCVTFLLFGFACLSAIFRLPTFYIMTLIGFLVSVVVKILAICVWIKVRIEIDWHLGNEMLSALRNYYKTDNSDNSLYYSDTNLGFNFLFYEGDCCGINSIEDLRSFTWASSFTYPSNPVTCHLTIDTVRWYTNREVSTFKNTVYTDGCGGVVKDSIHKYDVTGIVLLLLALMLEITTMVLLDRRYKRTVSPDQMRGAFSTFIHHVKGNRVNSRSGLPGLTAKILAFVSLTAFLMFAEILLWIGVLLGTFAPGYLKNGFFDNLNIAEENFNDKPPHLGYLIYGFLIAVFVMELVFVFIHVLTIFAIRALQKGYIHMSAVLLALMILCDIVTLSIASVLLDKAGYNCKGYFGSSTFCDVNAWTVFPMTGVFIGFNVVHILILCILIGLGLHVSKSALSITLVVPVEELSGLDDVSHSQSISTSVANTNSRRTSINRYDRRTSNIQSNKRPLSIVTTSNVSNESHKFKTVSITDQRTSLDEPTTDRRTSVAESTTDRETSVAESTTDRRTSVAESTTDRRTSVAESTTDRRTSVAESTTDRETSVAESTTDRRTSVAESTTDRRTSVAEPTTDRRTSVAEPTTDRRTSVTEPTTDRRTSVAESTTDRRTSVAEPTTDRRTSTDEPTIDRRTSIAESTTDRRTSVAEPTTDRRTSVAEPTTDRRTSVAEPTTDRRKSVAEPTTDQRTSTDEPTTDRRTSVTEPTTDRRTSVAEPTTDRRSSVAEPTTDRQTSVAEPTTDRRSSVAEPTTDRQTSVAEPTTDRQTSVAEPTTDRRTSVAESTID